MTAGSDKLKAKFKVLNDDVEHHAEEEIGRNMFPKVRKASDSNELEELGQELEAAKQKNRCRKPAEARPHKMNAMRRRFFRFID